MKAKKTRLSRKKRVALEGWLRKERVRLEKRPLLKTAILEMAIQKRPAPKMKYGAKTKLMPNEREHCPTLVVSNLPAINVEEVGQEALTSANLLTADEVAGKFKRTLKGSTEKTKTDKKRERRKKKVHQAEKFKKLSLVEAAKSAPPTKGKGHIRLADPALKSSAQFFSQLETQAKKHIQGSKRPAEEQFKSDRTKAKKFKL
ncbi:unnamed protein product [Nesidiocoris tenuis]|uniref:Uncharacterized protein n=1 Tax=Nesidiocoris tenuis TaxID=355587 RepID=A0A6H5GY45_9HEMI|nr:unnamed protein product [Nesidiocoris tenuis]